MIETGDGGSRAAAVVDAAARRKILIRRDTCHAARFADRFVKVSRAVPEAWVERFCHLPPEIMAKARARNDVPPQR